MYKAGLAVFVYKQKLIVLDNEINFLHLITIRDLLT